MLGGWRGDGRLAWSSIVRTIPVTLAICSWTISSRRVTRASAVGSSINICT